MTNCGRDKALDPLFADDGTTEGCFFLERGAGRFLVPGFGDRNLFLYEFMTVDRMYETQEMFDDVGLNAKDLESSEERLTEEKPSCNDEVR